MTGRELVGALIRVAGLALVGLAAMGAAYAGMARLGAPMPAGYTIERAIVAAALYALVGCLLIVFAPELTRFAYLRDPPER